MQQTPGVCVCVVCSEECGGCTEAGGMDYSLGGRLRRQLHGWVLAKVSLAYLLLLSHPPSHTGLIPTLSAPA